MLDSEAAVVVNTHIARMSGCRFFVTESYAVMCREPVPNSAITIIFCAEVNMWRNETSVGSEKSAMHAALEENPTRRPYTTRYIHRAATTGRRSF